MKYPIGFTFEHLDMTYEVVEHKENLNKIYLVKFGYTDDIEDVDHMEMTEHEMFLSVNKTNN